MAWEGVWSGIQGQEQLNQKSDANRLGMLAQLVQLQNQQETANVARDDRARQAQFRGALATLGENPTHEQVVGLAAKSGLMSPKDLASTFQASQDRRDALAQRAELAKAERERKASELTQKLEDRRITAQERADTQRELAQMRIDAQREMRAMAGAMRPEPAVTPVTIQDPNNPNATLVIDGRSGRVFGSGPKLTESGKLEQKRQFNMQGIGATIQKAEDLLSGKSGRDLPTGSGVGAVLDYAGGLIGASPTGAKEAEDLRALGGALVSKMPRMEGPQSDKDVALYKEMAARVGDATIPRERRLSALDQVKNIWAKYENLNPAAFSGSSPAPSVTPPAPKGAWSVVR